MSRATIKIDGLDALRRGVKRFQEELNKTCARASIAPMARALASAKSSPRFQDHGRAYGKWAHPPGNLRTKLRVWTPPSIRRNMNTSWSSVAVPYRGGAAYYIPLTMGHVVRNASIYSTQRKGRKTVLVRKSILISYRPKAKTYVEPRPFMQDAIKVGKSGARRHYENEINALVARFRP